MKKIFLFLFLGVSTSLAQFGIGFGTKSHTFLLGADSLGFTTTKFNFGSSSRLYFGNLWSIGSGTNYFNGDIKIGGDGKIIFNDNGQIISSSTFIGYGAGSGMNQAHEFYGYVGFYSPIYAFEGADISGLLTVNSIFSGAITSSSGIKADSFYQTGTKNNYFGGSIGIGESSFLHRLVGASSISTNLNAFNFVNSDINTNKTTVSQATDTSSFSLRFSATGSPILSLRNKTGGSILYVDSVGVGIGKIPSFALDINGHVDIPLGSYFKNNTNSMLGIPAGGGAIEVGWIGGGSNTTKIGFGAGGVNEITFTIANTAKVIIKADGNIGVNKSTNVIGKVDVAGTIRLSDTLRVGDNTTFSWIRPGESAWTVSSDISLKTDIKNYNINFANFKNVKPKIYKFKEKVFYKDFDESTLADTLKEAEKNQIRIDWLKENRKEAKKLASIDHKGFLAQEFNKELFNKDSKEINYSDVINVLWLKVQELEKRIEMLENK